jgi:hypothetical protein
MSLLVAGTISAGVVSAQSSKLEQFRSQNAEVAKLQPVMVTPLVAADPRLIQYVRIPFVNQFTTTGQRTAIYGNGRGIGVICKKRFEFDAYPPAYIQHNGSAKDGFGDTSVLAKYRIASAGAGHGNYILTAMLAHSFATGSATNGARTDVFTPTLAGGVGLKHGDLISAISGTLPTGKIATQGRTIVYNNAAQWHVNRGTWLELENNSTFYFSGGHDGKTQNFITPAAFYVIRAKNWKPTHPFFVVNTGMQIATSGFHTYNHSLISELRILF